MKKLMLVLAGTLAMGLAAQADEWFDGGIADGWPNSGSKKGGDWCAEATTLGTYENNAVTVNATADTPLKFAATEGKAVSNNTITVTSTITFTPFAVADIPTVPENAKAGVIAVIDGNSTNFYALAKNGEKNAWTKTEITATGNSAVVEVTFTDGTNVTYTIGGGSTGVLGIIIPNNDNTIKTANYVGTGKVASLAATYTAKPTGPSIDPVIGGETKAEITKVGDDYVVTPNGDGTVKIKDAGDASIVVIVDDVKIIGVSPANITVKNAGGDVIPAGALKGGDAAGFDTALDPAATVEGVSVTPELVEETETEKPLVVDDNVSTTVKSIPNLTYKLKRGDNIGTYPDTADTETATGKTVTLTDESKPTTKAFYIIEVTK